MGKNELRMWRIGEEAVYVKTVSGALYMVASNGETAGGSGNLVGAQLVGSLVNNISMMPGHVVKGGNLLLATAIGIANSSKVVEILWAEDAGDEVLEALKGQVDPADMDPLLDDRHLVGNGQDGRDNQGDQLELPLED